MFPRASRGATLALSLLITGCSLAPAPRPSPTPSPKAQPADINLRLLEAEDPQTLDPALIDDPVSLAVGSELFEGLTRLDGSQRPVPGLAERWDIADGGRSYTFHLRRARYGSGASVTAQDALTAWSRALAPKTASPLTVFFAPLGPRSPGDALTTVEVVDPTTLRLNLPRADSELLSLLALPPFWLYDAQRPGATPSGTGPYRLERWDRGRSLQLLANDAYRGGRPMVRRVDIEIEPDAAKRLDRFRSGTADVVHGLTGPALLDFARDPARAARLHRVPTTRTTWLGFNALAGGRYGPPARRALAQAIDRARLTDLALFGSMMGEPATDWLPPGVPGHIDHALVGYDPAASRRALDQAGFPGQIDLYFSTNSTVSRVARDLQDQIATSTGRRVVLHPVPDFFKRASLDQLPLLIDTWTLDVPHPADLLENVLRSNAQFNSLHIQDSQVDAALDAGRAGQSLDQALIDYQRAEDIALTDVRVIPLYSGVDPYLVRRGLTVPFTGGQIAYRWEDVR